MSIQQPRYDTNIHTRSFAGDRFETQPPKEFFSPPAKPPVKPALREDWRSVITTAIIVGGFCLMAEILHQPDKLAPSRLAPPIPDPTPVLVQRPAPVPEVRRAQLVSYPNDWRGWIAMPDGTPMDVHYVGEVGDFSQLPKYPGWHDMYRVTGLGTWVYAVPAGFSHATWIDP